MRNCRFLPGQLLFNEGDPSDCAYIIRSGRVEVTKATPDGPLRLAVLGKGEVLGEMGLVEERPRSASARALDVVVADAVNPGEFHNLVLNKPKEAIAFIRTLMERLRSMNRAVVEEHQARQEAVTIARHGLEVRLLPLSQAATSALPEEGLVLTRFPYRIGRKPVESAATDLSMNELEFAASHAAEVSRNHCAIDFDNGKVVVRDRGSQRGTLVNDKAIGVGALQDVAALKTGDNEIILGGPTSPIRLVALVKSA